MKFDQVKHPTGPTRMLPKAMKLGEIEKTLPSIR